MELSDLVGLHELSGVDFATETLLQYGTHYEDCQLVNFVLDGKTYTAVEDPNDGYRSSMAEIKVTDFKVANTFEPVQVVGMMRVGRFQGDYDVLDLVDVKTGKIVLSVGTDHTDDYYPTFVSDWQPENLVLNEVKP